MSHFTKRTDQSPRGGFTFGYINVTKNAYSRESSESARATMDLDREHEYLRACSNQGACLYLATKVRQWRRQESLSRAQLAIRAEAFGNGREDELGHVHPSAPRAWAHQY